MPILTAHDMLARDLINNIEDRLSSVLKAIQAVPCTGGVSDSLVEAFHHVELGLSEVVTAKELLDA